MLWRCISLSLAAQREKALVVVRRVVASATNALATREVGGGEEGGAAMGAWRTARRRRPHCPPSVTRDAGCRIWPPANPRSTHAGGAWSSGKKKAESQKGEGGEHRRRVERPPPDRLPRISSGAVARARRPPFPLGLVEPDRRSDASPARRRPMSPDQVTLGCLGWSLEGGWPPWISPAM